MNNSINISSQMSLGATAIPMPPLNQENNFRCPYILRKSGVLVVNTLVILAGIIYYAAQSRGLSGLLLLAGATAPAIISILGLCWAAGKKAPTSSQVLFYLLLGAIISVVGAIILEFIPLFLFGSPLKYCNSKYCSNQLFAEQENTVACGNSAVVLDNQSFKPVTTEKTYWPFDVYQVFFDSFKKPRGLTSLLPLQMFLEWFPVWGIVSSNSPHAQAAYSVTPVSFDGFDQGYDITCVAYIFVYMILCIGLMEEFAKAIVMYTTSPSKIPPASHIPNDSPFSMALVLQTKERHEHWYSEYLPHPLTFVVCGCIAAVGFALVENISYVFYQHNTMTEAFITAFVRSFTAFPSHIANTGITVSYIAYACYQAFFYYTYSGLVPGDLAHESQAVQSIVLSSFQSQNIMFPFWKSLGLGIFVPAILHGSYDAALVVSALLRKEYFSNIILESSYRWSTLFLWIAIICWAISIYVFHRRFAFIKSLPFFYEAYAMQNYDTNNAELLPTATVNTDRLSGPTQPDMTQLSEQPGAHIREPLLPNATR